MRLIWLNVNGQIFPDTLRNRKSKTVKIGHRIRRAMLDGKRRRIVMSFLKTFSSRARTFSFAGVFLVGLFLFLLPTPSPAAQTTLTWDANATAVQGYRIYQRTAGQSYDYNRPVWPTDGANHTETTCTISNLTDGVTYYFVARAYLGDEQSGDSNEVSYHAGQTAPTPPGVNNQPPAAEAGNNKTVDSGEAVILDGSDSFDPDGDPLSYHWTQVSGPNAALTGADSIQCSFTAPNPGDQPAAMVFELTATDSKGMASGDTCVVLINPAQPSGDNDGNGVPDDWPPGDGKAPIQYEEANHAPQVPGIISPADGETSAALKPWLEVSEFSDQDSDDQHVRTQWRISLSSDSQQIVLDRTCESSHLTQLQVPDLVLDPSTTYSVQVRFYDNHGEPSPWSWPVTFTTQPDPNDENRNRVPDAQEVSAGADVNKDSIPDLDQPMVVKSVVTYNQLHMMAISIETDGTGAQVQAAVNIDPRALISTEYSTSYQDGEIPFGLLGYKIRVDQPGQGVVALIHLSDAMDPRRTQWACFDEISGLHDCSSEMTIDPEGITVQRYLFDGGDEDADGVANGVIIDRSGPRASNAVDDASLSLTTDGQAASGRGDIGCFITTVLIP